MQSKRLQKIFDWVQFVATIITALYGLVYIVKELPSISWTDWANFVAHFMKILETIVTTLGWLFIIWILYKFAMFGLHKWHPDIFDENGHMRKDKEGE